MKLAEEEEKGMARNVGSLRWVERRMVERGEYDQKEMAWLRGRGKQGAEARAEKNEKVEFLTW